jgi:hypothetical protein
MQIYKKYINDIPIWTGWEWGFLPFIFNLPLWQWWNKEEAYRF